MEIKPRNQMLVEATGNKIRFVHIGNGGGTGGILTSQLLKVISGVSPASLEGVTYVGADGDEFEPKNLLRQLCIPKDMGKNKAEVIVSRYANAYRLPSENVSFVSDFIKTEEQLLKMIAPKYNRGSGQSSCGFHTLADAVEFMNTTIVLIDTVDKNAPRKLIHDFVSKTYMSILSNIGHRISLYDPVSTGALPTKFNLYTISCGNGEWTGQTVFGRKAISMVSAPTKPGSSVSFDYLPMKEAPEFTDPSYSFTAATAFEKYDTLIDLEEDKREESLSCADRAVENVQTMNANNMAASFALNYCSLVLAAFDLNCQSSGKSIVGMPDDVYKALCEKKLKCVTAIGEVKFNALTNSMRSIPFGEE